MRKSILDEIRKNFKMLTQIKVLSIALVVWVVLVMLVFLAIRVNINTRYIVPESSIHGRTVLNSGKEIEFTGSKFDTQNKKDTLYLTYEISADEIRKIPNPVFYFDLYNAQVKIYDGDKLIYEDTTGESREFTGNRIYEVPVVLKDSDTSKEITIEARSLAKRSYAEINACVVSASESWKFPLEGKEMLFVLMVSFMIISSFLIVITLFMSLFTKKIQIGVPLFSLMLYLSGWSLSSHRLLYLLTDNVDLAARAEYYFIVFVPLFIAFFMSCIFKKDPMRRISQVMLLVDVVVNIIVFLFDAIRPDFSIQDIVPLTNIILGTYMIIFGIGLFASRENAKKLSIRILRTGSIISVVSGVVEVIRYNLAYVDNTAISSFDVGAYSIAIMAITLMFYYVTVIIEDTSTKVGRVQLEKMAYKDQLTGLPNRADLDRHLDKMVEDDVKDYAIVFMDVNNLKVANDNFGHEVGDELLKCCANSFQEVFGDGFCCRWGGDEFVAIVKGSRKDAENKMSEFDDKIRVLNEAEVFAFEVSAAIGVAVSTSLRYVNPKSVLREADQEMYSLKQKMKRFY